MEVFKNKNVITNLGGEAQRLYERIENLEVQKTEMIIRENYFKYLTDYIAMGEGLDQIILPSSVGISDAILSKLISDMIDSQTQIKMYMGKEIFKTRLCWKERIRSKTSEGILLNPSKIKKPSIR